MKTVVTVEKTTQKTITSRELSNLSWRRHDHIQKSIVRMNKDLLEMSKPPVKECEYIDNNRTCIEYTLTIYQVELLALALDWKARIKVLDKLEQLRTTQSINLDQTNPMECLDKWISLLVQAWLWLQDLNKQYAELFQNQEDEIKNLKLKLENSKIVQTSIANLWTKELNISIEEMWKILWISRQKLFKELRYRDFLKLNNKPYKQYLDKLFVVIDVKFLKWHKNTNYKQTFITPNWIEFFTNLFNQKLLANT